MKKVDHCLTPKENGSTEKVIHKICISCMALMKHSNRVGQEIDPRLTREGNDNSR